MSLENGYAVSATWEIGRRGVLTSEGIEPAIRFSSPPEFKGDAGVWTPEHLLVASVATCYVATFSAIAEMSKMAFLGLQLSVVGKLGKPEGKLRFTEIVLKPTLTLAAREDHERAVRLLEKAEMNCLIARSLACPVTMEYTIREADAVMAT